MFLHFCQVWALFTQNKNNEETWFGCSYSSCQPQHRAFWCCPGSGSSKVIAKNYLSLSLPFLSLSLFPHHTRSLKRSSFGSHMKGTYSFMFTWTYSQYLSSGCKPSTGPKLEQFQSHSTVRTSLSSLLHSLLPLLFKLSIEYMSP